tara:strand:- start:33202 stop:33684 length:483 start_codon:yes stop_codon:yes gene_type:complete
MAIELSDNILLNIMRNYIKENINKEYVIDLINSKLSDSDKGILLELLLTQEEHEPFDINDIVWIKMDKYGDYGEIQSLKDINLIQDNHTLAKITGSDNYGTEFDKWHYKFKIEVIILRDKDNWQISEQVVDRKNMKHIVGSNLSHKMTQAFRDKYSEIAI